MTMKRAATLCSIVLAASGCAAGSGNGDEPGATSNPDGSSLDVSGKFKVRTTFDFTSRTPAAISEIVSRFIDATDPTRWVLAQMIARADADLLPTLSVNAAALADTLNARFGEWAPDFVTSMLRISSDLSEISDEVVLLDTLDIAKTGQTYQASHALVGTHFKIGTVDADFAFADYSLQIIPSNAVGITIDDRGQIAIARHKIAISYGQIMRIGLEGAIIPQIDDGAFNLNNLLMHLISCEAMGQIMVDAIGGDQNTMASACYDALDAEANEIYQTLDATNQAAFVFELDGTATGRDTNTDGRVDQISGGGWTGSVSYRSVSTPLAVAAFTGARI